MLELKIISTCTFWKKLSSDQTSIDYSINILDTYFQEKCYWQFFWAKQLMVPVVSVSPEYYRLFICICLYFQSYSMFLLYWTIHNSLKMSNSVNSVKFLLLLHLLGMTQPNCCYWIPMDHSRLHSSITPSMECSSFWGRVHQSLLNKLMINVIACFTNTRCLHFLTQVFSKCN